MFLPKKFKGIGIYVAVLLMLLAVYLPLFTLYGGM